MRNTTRKATMETTSSHAVRTEVAKPIILEVQGDTLTFRHKGERQRWTLSIPTAFREAIARKP